MFERFGANEIKPAGWLKNQLVIQAKGLSGNLDKIWPDVRDSAWIGGDKDGWERVPYWLDGFIPLSFLLKDEDMIERSNRYINAILDRQCADGWICPCSEAGRRDYDLWAYFLIGKVLALYCEFTESERARTGLYRAMKCLYELMADGKITMAGRMNWGEFRWFEGLIPLEYLYREHKEDWIIRFAKLLKREGADYFQYSEHWKRPINRWVIYTHIVNLCMALKYEVVYTSLTGETCEHTSAELWDILEKYNGTAVGTFTGDECLSGLANNQGTELCSVAELMYSCELLYAMTGDAVWADRLEKAALNALPATISDDMWTHQYDQMVNQIACIQFPGKSFFRTNSSDAHLFGLEPGYGCCTANFNQAWPKLAMNPFLKSEKGVLCAHMLPAELNTEVDGTAVSITTETEYPFRLKCKYMVKAEKEVAFELKIRIPQWAKGIKIDGQAVEQRPYITIDKVWNGVQIIEVELIDQPHLVERPGGLKVVNYGPLVFSLPIEAEYKMSEYTRDGVERKFPYCDYELWPQSEWRYGFSDDKFTVCEKEGDDVPFSSKAPRLTLKANLCRVDWDFADGYDTVSDKFPLSDKALSAPEEIELIPYGCAKLRMTEMPLAKK